MRTKTLLFFLTLAAPVGMGCATLFASGPDMVPVYSKPSGATVYLDNMEVGKTPCIVAVPRYSEGLFAIELAGYETATVDRDKVCNGITALNLLGGVYLGPVFFVVDAIAGNLGKYSTKPVNVELKPLKPPIRPPEVTPTPQIRPRWSPQRM